MGTEGWKPPRVAWNRVRIEARLATKVEIRELPGGRLVAFGKYRFRGSRMTGDGISQRYPAVTILLMATGNAARFLAEGEAGQMCLAEGRLTSIALRDRRGKSLSIPRLIADYVELGAKRTERVERKRAEETGTVAGGMAISDDAEKAAEAFFDDFEV